MAAEYQQFLAIGRDLLLEGADLRAFVAEQQNLLRDAREVERQNKRDEESQRVKNEIEARKIEAELEEKKAQLSIAADEKRAELAADERREQIAADERRAELAAAADERRDQIAADERKAQLAAETELKRLELELQMQRETAREQRSENENNEGHGRRKPHGLLKLGLTNFREDIDDLSQYLLRFERMCERMEVPTDEWGLYLSRQLEGKALDVYERLSKEDVDNYEILKENLMKRFHLTEDGYKKRYKRSKLDEGETHPQFVKRLRRNLDRWRESAGLEANYGDLQELVLKDQYFESCSPELQTFIKEKGRCDLRRMAEFAEIYVEAHPRDRFFENKKHKEFKLNEHKTDAKSGQQPFNKFKQNQSKETKDWKEVQCTICLRKGHDSSKCYRKSRVKRAVREWGGVLFVVPLDIRLFLALRRREKCQNHLKMQLE